MIGLTKTITAKGMRRTFQDLARGCEVRKEVQMAISGHLSEEMRLLYSTVSEQEIRHSLDNIIDLAGIREARTKSRVYQLRKIA